MIPEESFNFNRLRTSSNFDHLEVRWPHLLQQGAVSALETGRHLLAVCSVCKHPWYKVGQQEYPRLTPEQLTFLGALLRVDIQALYLLPRALCPICSALYLGGLFSAEVYPNQSGYHFLWEHASPRRTQLLAMVCRGTSLPLDVLVQIVPDAVAEPTDEMRSVLTWLEACPTPDTITIQAFTDEQRQQLACRCPLGSTVDESLYQWHGYAWETNCPPLGDHVLVSLAVTTRSNALPPFASLRMSWQVLARAMRAVL